MCSGTFVVAVFGQAQKSHLCPCCNQQQQHQRLRLESQLERLKIDHDDLLAEVEAMVCVAAPRMSARSVRFSSTLF